MARSLEYTMKFDAPPATFYREYTSREFHEQAMAAFREVTPVSEITHFATGETGTDITFRHYVPPSHLPPLVRTIMPDLTVSREQRIEPFDRVGNRAEGTLRVSIPATAAQIDGRYVLTGTDTSSELHLDAECEIRIPLIGRILEQVVTSSFPDIFDYERAFIADWIAARRV